MKIVSRRKAPEVDIELDLKSLDELANTDIKHEDDDKPSQEEFDFYKEDWVIQTAIKLGYHVYHLTDTQICGFSIDGALLYICTEFSRQSNPDRVVQELRDTMKAYRQDHT